MEPSANFIIVSTHRLLRLVGVSLYEIHILDGLNSTASKRSLRQAYSLRHYAACVVASRQSYRYMTFAVPPAVGTCIRDWHHRWSAPSTGHSYWSKTKHEASTHHIAKHLLDELKSSMPNHIRRFV